MFGYILMTELDVYCYWDVGGEVSSNHDY